MTEHALPISSSTRGYAPFEYEATHEPQASSVLSIPSRRSPFLAQPRRQRWLSCPEVPSSSCPRFRAASGEPYAFSNSVLCNQHHAEPGFAFYHSSVGLRGLFLILGSFGRQN